MYLVPIIIFVAIWIWFILKTNQWFSLKRKIFKTEQALDDNANLNLKNELEALKSSLNAMKNTFPFNAMKKMFN